MTLIPLLTFSHRRQVEDNFIILQKIEYSDVFCCHSGYRQCTEFLKTESLFPDGSGHIFNFCLAPSWGEKTILLQNVLPQNVPPQNVQPQNVPPPKRPRLQNVLPTKRPCIQNVLAYKTSFHHTVNSSTFINRRLCLEFHKCVYIHLCIKHLPPTRCSTVHETT